MTESRPWLSVQCSFLQSFLIHQTRNPSCPAPSCTDPICPLWPPQHPSLRYHPSSVSLISYSNCAALPCLPIGHNNIVFKSYSYHVTHFAIKDFRRLFFPSLALSEGHKAGLSISTFHLWPSLLFSPSSAHLQLLVTFILMNTTHFLQGGLWAQKVVSIPQGLPQNSPAENPLHPFSLCCLCHLKNILDQHKKGWDVRKSADGMTL